MKPDPPKKPPSQTWRPGMAKEPTAAQLLLERLLKANLLDARDWQNLPTGLRQELENHNHPERLLARLVQQKLLTEYQAGRIRGEKIHGLIMENYRVLDRLGVGNMGVVFKAEHIPSRRTVAVKVLIPAHASDTGALLRFFAERKTIAQLQHLNIARALDVGETATPDPDQPMLYYYAMEYFSGVDLEKYVQQHGPLKPARACEIAFQVASALTEAQRHHLVHRDIEPANILLTDDGPVKVLDFGLVRQFATRQTEPGTLLGTLDYVSPEQAADASAVDIRADIYSLGACLFWALTGKAPYASLGAAGRDLAARQTTAPPLIRTVRPDIAPELEAVIAKMLALKPADRYTTPHEVLEALAPFLPADSPILDLKPAPPPEPESRAAETMTPHQPHSTPRVLIVTGAAKVRMACREQLEQSGIACAEANSGQEALEIVAAELPDLVLLDSELPDAPGLAVLQELRRPPTDPQQKIIVLLRTDKADSVSEYLAAGADDYVLKPLEPATLKLRVKTALELKRAQEKADQLSRQLAAERNAPPPPPPPPEPKKGWLGKLFGK